MKEPLKKLLHNYNLARGGLWPLVLVTPVLA